MIDFTKQDLQMLYNMIIHTRNDYPELLNDKDCTDLKNKIKEKIEREKRKVMTKHEKVANIITFLAIMFGEDSSIWSEVMKFSPEYIIEKFERYVLSTGIENPWGMHPLLKNTRFDAYVDIWGLELKDE